MKPRMLLRPGQAAWLAEIGVDTHWLGVLPARVAPPAVDPGITARPLAGGTEPDLSVDPAQGGPDALADQGGRTPDLVATGDIAALAAAITACERCVRHTQRTRAVPGAGAVEHPRYLILGEQPGIEDDASGLPFQGDQGRLLQAMLAGVRLPQAQSSYRTHVVKCRAMGGGEPSDQEIAVCLPYLHREIALLQPQWILALGRVAAQAVLGSRGSLDALRGGPHDYVPPGGGAPIPVWVTHQPSSLLVRSGYKAEAWRDLVGWVQAVQAAQA